MPAGGSLNTPGPPGQGLTGLGAGAQGATGAGGPGRGAAAAGQGAVRKPSGRGRPAQGRQAGRPEPPGQCQERACAPEQTHFPGMIHDAVVAAWMIG